MDREIGSIQDAVEAILFASGEAVPVGRISDVFSINEATAEKVMQHLADRFNAQHGGIRIVKLEDGWQMCTRPEFVQQVREALDLRRNSPLTQASLEVLAVIAYHQPVTKAFVEQVRGVDCTGVLSGLIAKGLVEECGRLNLPGKPLLYGTTPDFLRCVGISSLQDLPPVEKEAEHSDGEEHSGQRETVAEPKASKEGAE